MRKVLICGLSSKYGGVEAFVINYVNHLPKEDYNLECILIDQKPDYLQKKLKRPLETHIVCSRTKDPLRYYSQIRELLKKGRYDIVWCNVCTLTDIAVLKLSKKFRVPVRIIHSHNSQNMGGKLVLLTHLMNKQLVDQYATHFFACSDLAGTFMYGQKILDHPCYRMIPNAIDVNEYLFDPCVRQKKRTDLGLQEKVVIGNVGRLHFQKNQKYLLQIFAEFHNKRTDSVLMIVGEGELHNELAASAEQLGISDAVLFLGQRSDVNELMQAMDVFVLPSLFEGLPVVAIEAQAAGLPCILADTITEQTKITDLVFYESLKAAPEQWIEKIKKGLEKERRNCFVEISSAGYNIEKSAKDIFGGM